jgi:hypothetical protein
MDDAAASGYFTIEEQSTAHTDLTPLPSGDDTFICSACSDEKQAPDIAKAARVDTRHVDRWFTARSKKYHREVAAAAPAIEPTTRSAIGEELIRQKGSRSERRGPSTKAVSNASITLLAKKYNTSESVVRALYDVVDRGMTSKRRKSAQLSDVWQRRKLQTFPALAFNASFNFTFHFDVSPTFFKKRHALDHTGRPPRFLTSTSPSIDFWIATRRQLASSRTCSHR